MTGYWVGVASRDHVRKAVEGGFCQFSHGKEAPLKRIAPGDGILYYSPRERMNAGEPLQAFTAIGTIGNGDIYQAAQSGTFDPFRRKVAYRPGTDAPIRPMLDELSFTRGKRSWGQVMRRGLFGIQESDFALILEAMGASKGKG